jgi:hypothetical protein
VCAVLFFRGLLHRLDPTPPVGGTPW